jgi:delta-aminolevulinic acid dehydratase/porphobilinogen synthase
MGAVASFGVCVRYPVDFVADKRDASHAIVSLSERRGESWETAVATGREWVDERRLVIERFARPNSTGRSETGRSSVAKSGVVLAWTRSIRARIHGVARELRPALKIPTVQLRRVEPL